MTQPTISAAPIERGFSVFLSGARERVGFSKHGKRIFGRNDYTHSSEVALKESHTIDYFIRLLSSIGIAPTQEPLTATLPDSSRNDLPEELREATVLNASRESNKEMGYAVIHPGTARPEKYWRSDRWAEVIKHVSSQGLTPVITGAAGEEEVAHVSQIKAALDGNVPVIDLVGKLSFLESAQVISQCRIFLGVDTRCDAPGFGLPAISRCSLRTNQRLPMAPSKPRGQSHSQRTGCTGNTLSNER